ncbi:uncharacterized protein [Typha latifolia]|uniref:uncharacterized protein isoform X1 n=1 Tax=Typha latifolia TaxID=4733 RepID=UPI003C2B50AA
MGAVTDHRKRGVLDISLPHPFYDLSPSVSPPSKKSKFLNPPLSTPSRSLPPLPRLVHAPQRILKAFGLGAARNSLIRGKDRTFAMDNQVSRYLKNFKADSTSSRRRASKDSEGSEVCSHTSFCKGESDVRTGRRATGNVPDSHDGNRIREKFKNATHLLGNYVSEFSEDIKGISSSFWSFLKREKKKVRVPKLIVAGVSGLRIAMRSTTNLSDLHIVNQRKVDDARSVALGSTYCETALDKNDTLYKLFLEESKRHDDEFSALEHEEKLSDIGLENEEVEEEPDEDLHRPFSPLSDEEEREVHDAFCGGSRVLVMHEESNIEITRKIFQCLRVGGWLNDEVINLYLALLKQREIREPEKFHKCHFFNTFFYKKLTAGRNNYDYKAVRKWTSHKKLGYGLIECRKIFVPIHQGAHWCLAVINIDTMTFQYLDSLGGMDPNVLSVLAEYLEDEVKDKSDKEINTRSWKQESVDGLPLQTNGSDCGMFMLKYIDFYSRGLQLSFSQDHMNYFRMRTAKEILRLRAE